MSLDLGSLVIKAVIVHQIPKADLGTPFYSEVSSPLDDNLKLYIKQRIIESTKSSSSFPVILDASSPSPVPAFATSHIDKASSEDEFVQRTRQAAEYLVELQNKLHSAGLLTFVDCAVKSKRALAVLKLERNSGIRAKPQKINGKVTLSIERVSELMLTDSNRVFKAGIFSKTNDEVSGIVSDHQRSLDVAQFFLKFLGCQLREEPNVATKRFFALTEDFIDKVVADPQRKVRYQMALAAEMQSPKKQIRPRAFAEDNLEPNDRQPYLDFLEEEGAAAAIHKDTELISNRVSGLHMAFATGISVYLPPKAIEDGQAEIKTAGDGATKLTIKDTLVSTKAKPRGRRRPKQPD